MPTVREYEAALRRNPADTEAFVALRKAFRQAEAHDKLVTLYETRAQAIDDGPKAGELFYLAAELRIDQLGDAVGAEADLANAVDRDPGHIRAATRLKDIYREQGRMADYMTMLEMEAAAVARTRDPGRIAELQSEMGQLFVNHFGKLERAVRSPQRAGKLGAEDVKTIESARKIYRALGDYRSVVRLYELELEGTADAKRRADLLLGLGRVLGEKLEELDAAAQRLTEVVRLRPRDEKALELLAGVYANPNWIGADGLERAAAIYFQIARRRQEAGDADNAVAALRRALTAVPGHPESGELLERVYYDARRFSDLDRYYRERVQAATSETERVDFLYKRAQLSESELEDLAEAQRVYGEIAALEPPGGPASEKLSELYAGGHEYAKLAELRERQLGVIEEPVARTRIMLELAALYRDRLGDRDQAAVYLHAVLQLEPENPVALAAYAEHFREKGDWVALADLLEFSFDRARVAGAVAEDLVARLEEIAVVAEKNLGDIDRALGAWQRIEELQPQHTRAREAQRRMLLKAKDWDRMAALLEREAGQQSDAPQRNEILRRIAQIHREKLGNAKRAIEIYREILRSEPQDALSTRALVDLYEHEGDFAGLAGALREQIETAPSVQERDTLLRKVLAIYDERLADLAQGQWAATEILEAVPGDRDTLARLESILERAGDPRKLAIVLDQHVKHAASSDEKVQLVARIAEIHQGPLQDPVGAAARWEEVVRLDPDDARALAALEALYVTLGQPAELARVLDLQVERVVADPAAQADYMRALARLNEQTLRDIPRARRSWEQLCEILPGDAEALEALSRIYTGEGDWATLVRILERQVPLAKEPARAGELALLRVQILDERLHNLDEAARGLEQVIAELDPRSWVAHERLRALYERNQDWARVVKVAERQLFLTEDPAQRTPRALEVGVLWRDRLGDEKKAVTAFERVLEIDGDNLEALQALAALYATMGNHQRLAFTDEKLLDQTQEPAARRQLMLEIAKLYEDQLADPHLAFEWVRRAYTESPDAEALQLVDAMAERHGLFEELIQIYEGARARVTEPTDQLAASLKIAFICEEKLADAARAFATLREALPADPTGRELLPGIERLAERTGDWAGLLDVYTRVARGRGELAERVEILRLRAVVRETRMTDASGALDEFLRSFALAPEIAATRDEILRLARATNRWEEALKVQGQLFALAEDLPEKLSIARNAAYLVEHEVKDLVRAFRAYLNAFRLAPDDDEITDHLWRLAALIGRYDGAPETRGEPVAVAAVVTDDADILESRLMTDAGVAATSPAETGEDDEHGPGSRSAADDIEATLLTTAELDVKVDDAVGEAADLELSEEDLDEALEGEEGDGIDVVAAPPPPPPSPARRGAPSRFATPWEELAAAYDTLPAEDTDERRVHLLKIVALWEKGAKDVERALDAIERAFRLDSTDQTVRAELDRMGAAYEAWDRVAAIYLGAIDEFGAVERAVELHHDVARIRERLGQVDKAEEIYRAILSLKSDDTVALGRVEEFARAEMRYEDLADVLDKRTSAGTEALPAGPERRAKMRELATLYEDRLEKPYEAIDTLERYVAEAAEDAAGAPDVAATPDAYEALERLYSRVGLWAKVVESLQRHADVVTDTEAARALRLRVAFVYEKELGQPDRAIEAYQALVAQAPDDGEALAALDRLHETHGHFDDLQETLGRRSALASGVERVELVRRRARILEDRLANPEAAAAAVRELGDDAIRDDELMVVLLRNLRRAGLAHEAARVLSRRIEIERATGSSPEILKRVAGLSLELSLLRLDDLNDPDAARREVESALRASPENPAALAALARLYLKENDFQHYAETRVRQARALRGAPGGEAVEALLDAGRVYREQLSLPEHARTCFEEALVEDPTHGEALRGLAALLASQGHWDEARGILERQLDSASEPGVRAAVLTDLGRAAWEGLGDAATAQQRLEEALALAPDHLPAVLAIADIYYKEGQWELAEKRLTEAVRKLRTQPQQAARLYQRLAEVHEKLGKLDEAYRQLVEADRMNGGQLLTKLSLGENRFRAGKWREAALHLGPLADHPDAAMFPEEVADAVAHAAQAETKLRRPEKAMALYEAALTLRPTHRASLRALADLALERGERQKAAAYLRRMAETTTDFAERARLWEQLGDLALESDDDAQALRSYEEALKAEGPPREEHVGLLEKALDLQRKRGDGEAAARTSALLIDLVKDPKERAARRRDAAVLMAERGNPKEAAALLDQALAEDVYDEDALVALCDLGDKAIDKKALKARLARTLPELPELDAAVAGARAAHARRARLWERLGELQRKRDPGAAMRSFEAAVALDPERLPAREALVALYGDKPEHADAAAEIHRRLLMADVTRSDSLRALAAGYARRGFVDRARCCYEVLALLGETTREENAYLDTHPSTTLKPDDPYAAPIDDQDRKLHLAMPDAIAMAEIFSSLWDGAPGLIGQRVEDFGVSAQDKISPMSDLDLGKIYGQVAKALANKKTALYLKAGGAAAPGAHDVTIVVQSPPALVVGGHLAEGAPAAEVRFELARGLELSRPEYILAAGVRAKQFTPLFSNVLKAFHPRHARRRASDAGADPATDLKKNVPYKVSKRLVELFQELGTTSWSSVRWRAVVQHTGNRAGLLLCGDLKTAARLVLEEGAPLADRPAEDLRALAKSHEAFRDLLRFAISEDYFVLREKVGTAIARAAAA
ncbi:MAG TPA: tetratricopeptide repeat protein [Polyangia bacterium]|nr:tetratricopeptide repeat protein [Polyangia bacterium]